ncbi:DUF4302 domain-containing protein [Sphingobacterium hotanense]|uniref:DUF4302 domain-containing protein n=1 Tax=Sphingobacterium hotanense TaxID=649196 RepID=A0ABT7NLF1_9SPHI|nr:DUF4302 domain-containing protein [Sphingobacterium hotanense]MDM1048084.1 DUF4302 domain-containing protein [Sphingobacterium hotanense]
MKKILIYIVGLFLLAGCEKEKVDLTFGEKPEERVSERLAELRGLLTSAENGWNASLNTGGKGGYGFFFDFEDAKTVNMLSDLTAETSSTLNSSTYRVIWAMNASLVFDTFNYLTMLQEPSGSYGGTAPNGYQSDIEFEYLKSSGDSLFMVGKKYKQALILTKASAAQKAAYLDDVMQKKKSQISQYLNTHFNNYITVEGVPNPVSVNLSNTSKTYTFQTVMEDGSVGSVTGKFHYTADDILFSLPIELNGTVFARAKLLNDVLTLYDSNGKAYQVMQSQEPVLSVETLYGYNKSYKSFGTRAEENTLPAVNISSTYPTILNSVKNKFGTVKFRYVNFKFEGRNKLSINVYYTSSANFTATMTVDYTYENGIMTLSNPTGNTTGNWNTRRTALRDLEDYILNNKTFKVDWVKNDAGIPVIGWYAVNDPTAVIYGFPGE